MQKDFYGEQLPQCLKFIHESLASLKLGEVELAQAELMCEESIVRLLDGMNETLNFDEELPPSTLGALLFAVITGVILRVYAPENVRMFLNNNVFEVVRDVFMTLMKMCAIPVVLSFIPQNIVEPITSTNMIPLVVFGSVASMIITAGVSTILMRACEAMGISPKLYSFALPVAAFSMLMSQAGVPLEAIGLVLGIYTLIVAAGENMLDREEYNKP